MLVLDLELWLVLWLVPGLVLMLGHLLQLHQEVSQRCMNSASMTRAVQLRMLTACGCFLLDNAVGFTTGLLVFILWQLTADHISSFVQELGASRHVLLHYCQPLLQFEWTVVRFAK